MLKNFVDQSVDELKKLLAKDEDSVRDGILCRGHVDLRTEAWNNLLDQGQQWSSAADYAGGDRSLPSREGVREAGHTEVVCDMSCCKGYLPMLMV